MKKIAFLLSLFASSAALAGGAASGGSSEWTQILNNIQLVDGYAQDGLRFQNEILRYEGLLKQLSDNPLGVAVPNLNLLVENQAKIMAYGSAIGQSMSQVDQNFAKQFKNPQAGSFGVRFGITANVALDALKSAMLNAGLQHDNAKTDAQNIKKLTDAVSASQGEKGATQALGAINAELLREAQQYRLLFAEQSTATNTAMAADMKQKQDAQTEKDSMSAPYAPPIPSVGKAQSVDWTNLFKFK
jgi:P-type conjugative transfer protein TrbJ